MRGYSFLLLLFFLSISICKSYGQELVEPLKGEGVHAFLRRNNREGGAYYKQFLELNRSKMGKNNTLRLGEKYQLPPIYTENRASSGSNPPPSPANGQKKREPLFGKKYEEYTVESDRLKGATLYLISGHGGPDPGAIGKYGDFLLHEDEYAYDIMLRLARALMIEGATVHIIIQDANDGIRDEQFLKANKSETCMGDPIPLNQTKRLRQRVNKVNAISSRNKSKNKYERVLDIHLDSRSKGERIDVFFYHHAESKSGKRTAETMLKVFDEHYAKHQPGRGFSGTVSSRRLLVLKETNPPAVLIELGNITNSFDQRRFLISDNRQALANWICRGLIRDYENFKRK